MTHKVYPSNARCCSGHSDRCCCVLPRATAHTWVRPVLKPYSLAHLIGILYTLRLVYVPSRLNFAACPPSAPAPPLPQSSYYPLERFKRAPCGVPHGGARTVFTLGTMVW